MNANDVAGLTSALDLEWLRIQGSRRLTILELGPYKGRSTRALAERCPGVVFAVDNWNARINRGKPDVAARAACYANLEDLRTTGKVVLLEHDSREGVPLLLADKVFDMIWIDAGHEREDVASDIATFAPLLASPGLICGHDYSSWHPGVVQAVDEAYGEQVRTVPCTSIWWVLR